MTIVLPALALISGICWMVVYVALAKRGFADETCGMPSPVLALNVSWELIFAFVPGESFAQIKGVQL
ncbi:hypothetical protein [Pendulispora albinea]|uniref:Uncharacterized protein n=1 Tax=Pendulispora albinea TaxID=2741071 RepID=A0ABZ2M1T8_9BACT